MPYGRILRFNIDQLHSLSDPVYSELEVLLEFEREQRDWVTPASRKSREHTVHSTPLSTVQSGKTRWEV